MECNSESNEIKNTKMPLRNMSRKDKEVQQILNHSFRKRKWDCILVEVIMDVKGSIIKLKIKTDYPERKNRPHILSSQMF